jgi:methyl-accepting chemotaxis protein
MSLVVGVVGVVNMGELNDMTTIMYEQDLLGLSEAKEIEILVKDADEACKNLLLATTEEEDQLYRKQWTEAVNKAEELITGVDSRFVSAEGKALVAQADKALADWVVVSREVVDLAASEAEGSDEQAIALTKGQSADNLAALTKALSDMTVRKETNCRDRDQSANALYKSSVLFMVIVILGAMIAGIAIGIILSSSVLKTVGGEPDQIAALTDQIADGNLDLDTSKRKSVTGIHRSLLHMIEKLKSIVGDITTAANEVSAGSEQLSTTSQTLSQGATEQAASVEEISSSMEEMTSNIKQNADNAQTTEKIALKSAQIAEEGGQAVTETVEAMKQIASKINIIEEIARSTNMLALNASIEAARAGEYGKGFAVVASEVGKLAERSQKESAEIRALSERSVHIAEVAGQTILGMIPDIKRTAELVQEISAASAEQNSGAEQINSAIMQLDQVVQQNASASEESSSMSEELASQAMQMQETISFFKLTGAAGDAGATGSRKSVARTSASPASLASAGEVKTAARKPESSSAPRANLSLDTRRGISLHLDDEDDRPRGKNAADADFTEF